MNNTLMINNVNATSLLDEQRLSRFIAFVDARSTRTTDVYRMAMRRFIQFLADRKIEAPSRQDIIAYRDFLATSGLKPATINLYLIAVRRFFRWTKTEGLYLDVTESVKGIATDKSFKKDALTSRQAKTVLQEIEIQSEQGTRDYAILTLMLVCGLRDIEVQRANVDDLRSLGDDTVIYVQGKGRTEKSDFVRVPEPVERAIRSYLRYRQAVACSEPLFTAISNRCRGGRMTTRSISRIVKTRLVKAGFNSPRLTAHSLRHTAATLNLLNGASIDETQQFMRHARIDTTMQYAHHLEKAANGSANRVASVIF